MANEMKRVASAELEKLEEIFGALAHRNDADDLTEGVTPSYPILSIKGRVFTVVHDGKSQPILNADGDTVSSITVVIAQSHRAIQKTYYKKQYQEGDDNPPDCWSLDGERPDVSIEEPVSPLCATCPMNRIGSRISDSGSKVKACSDSRRIALLPYPNLSNDGIGPLMLRVPTMSLGNLAKYGRLLKEKGVSYRFLVTRVRFAPGVAYPRLDFEPVKMLTADEGEEVAHILASADIETLFSATPDVAAGAQPATVEEKAEAAADAVPQDEPVAQVSPNTVADIDAYVNEVVHGTPAEAETEDPEPEPAKQARAKKEAPKKEAPKTPKEQAIDEGEEAEDDELDDILGFAFDD